MKLNLPLLLDGDAAGFCADTPAELCLQQWMLANPEPVAGMQREYAAAGADLLRAPTGGLSVLELSAFTDPPDSMALNSSIVDLTARAAQGKPVAGVIRSCGHLPEPCGPLPYTDLVDTYAQQALELELAGAQLLVLEGMRALADLRAAVLGARQTALEIFACMDASLPEEAGAADPLAMLLCLQELGISAFGVGYCEPGALARILERLAPYAKVPLLAQPATGDASPAELARAAFELVAAGGRILMGDAQATPAHTAALRDMLDCFDFDAFPLPVRAEDTTLLLTDEERVYYLEEDFTTAGPIACETDMSEAILRAEAEGADALLFHVRNVDDAYRLGQDAHMAGIAAVILADSEEALEAALLVYCGRPLVDSRSDADPDVMQTLAEGYGAIMR